MGVIGGSNSEGGSELFGTVTPTVYLRKFGVIATVKCNTKDPMDTKEDQYVTFVSVASFVLKITIYKSYKRSFTHFTLQTQLFRCPTPRNSNQRLKIIICCPTISLFMAAGGTPMGDYILSMFLNHGHRFHPSAAGGRTVPRGYVDMFAPETPRAVVGIPVAINGGPTVVTHKRFYAAGKVGCGMFALHPFSRSIISHTTTRF